MSSAERSGWRDEAISRKHREWGKDVPAVDIDFLMAEYDRAEPVAIIEYKQECAKPIPSGDPNLRTIANLADKADLPAFVVRYGADLSWFKARALNGKGREVLPGIATYSEPEYVTFLYELRGRAVPQEWSAKLPGDLRGKREEAWKELLRLEGVYSDYYSDGNDITLTEDEVFEAMRVARGEAS